MAQNELNNAEMRRRFRIALWAQLKIVWPIISALILIQLSLGVIAGYVEGWSLGESIYFTFVTGHTIGYGDFVPKHFISRLCAMGIGLIGVVFMGLIAAIAVHAFEGLARDAQR
ncbi:MAG TPA: potassium channel family protein [Rhodoblastus sp.]|nr:potassium channel family protein [Rhodoblastus sp.]